MNLIYNSTLINAGRKGQPVTVGDVVTTSDGESVRVTHFRPPHKPSSSGKVCVKYTSQEVKGYESEYYVSVIGAEWVARDDRN